MDPNRLLLKGLEYPPGWGFPLQLVQFGQWKSKWTPPPRGGLPAGPDSGKFSPMGGTKGRIPGPPKLAINSIVGILWHYFLNKISPLTRKGTFATEGTVTQATEATLTAQAPYGLGRDQAPPGPPTTATADRNCLPLTG